jgi:cytochrome c5
MERKMIVRDKYLLPGTLILTAMVAAVWAVAPAASPQTTKPPKTQQAAPAQPAPQQGPQPQEAGERIFSQNCSRCHAAPEGFSPRVSGTILRHMRVRASLSQRDEQELLRYLNP